MRIICTASRWNGDKWALNGKWFQDGRLILGSTRRRPCQEGEIQTAETCCNLWDENLGEVTICFYLQSNVISCTCQPSVQLLAKQKK